jgi:hypothetical protein
MEQFLITPAAGKRLIAKALAKHPAVNESLASGTIVIIAGTTNGYVAEEILSFIGQAENFSRKRFFRGVVLPPDGPVTSSGRIKDETGFPGDVVIKDGIWKQGKTIFDVVDDLREGDIIDVEYVNDVMPYVTKPNNSHNLNNENPEIQFPTKCPCCDSTLEISDSGKSVYCNNVECPGRRISRMVNMLDKLNIKDFAEANLSQIAKFSLTDLLNLTIDDVTFLGETISKNFINRMNEIKTIPMYDYKIVGSLGFTDIAIEKWKTVLNKYTIDELLNMDETILRSNLVNIKGIGPITADTIVKELDFFRKDLFTISKMNNITKSKGVKFGKSIRFTGFRDKQLIDKLNDMGHDANGNAGVTKTTDILLIPYAGYSSPKTGKIGEHTIIVPVSDFVIVMNRYL